MSQYTASTPSLSPAHQGSRGLRCFGTCLALIALALPLAAQRRAAAPKKVEFPTAVAAAKDAFEAGDFAGAIAHLAAATRAAQKLQRTAIYAAMPEITGFTKQPQPQENEDAAALAGILGALAGAQGIEQEYRQNDKGDQRITLKVTPNSPLVGMMNMMINNSAMLAAQKGQELVEYDGFKALLNTENAKRVKLTVLVGDTSTIEGESRNMSADEVLKVLSQANVDRLAATILPKTK